MFFKPNWFKTLPKNIRPENNKIERLEQLRKQLDIPHELFVMIIDRNPATTRKVQKRILEESRRLYPDAAEKELWMMVLLSRTETLKNVLISEMLTGEMSQEEVENKRDGFSKIIEEFEEVIKNIDSFEEFCDYIISIDKRLLGEEFYFTDPLNICQIIEEILEEWFFYTRLN